jgi:hypothetical protein
MLCYHSRYSHHTRKTASEPHDKRKNATKKRKENHDDNGFGYGLFHSDVAAILLFSLKQQLDAEQWCYIRAGNNYGIL